MAKRKLPIEDPFATPDAKTKEGIVPGVESEEEASASKETTASTKGTKKKATTKKKTTKKPATKKASSKRPALEDPFAAPEVKTREGIIPGLDLQTEPEPAKLAKATKKKTTKTATESPIAATRTASKSSTANTAAKESPEDVEQLRTAQLQILEQMAALSSQFSQSGDEQPVLEKLNTLEEYLHQLEQQLPGVEAQQFDTSALLETQQQLQQQLTQVPNEVLEPVLSRLQELQTAQGQLQQAVTAQATTEAPSLAPVENSLQQIQEALSQVQARLEEPTEFPPTKDVDLSGVEGGIKALQEQVQSLEALLQAKGDSSSEPVVAEPMDLSPVLEAMESLKGELSSIPGPTIVSTASDTEVDLEPVVTLLQGIRQELRQQAEVLVQLPTQFPAIPEPPPTAPRVDLSPLQERMEALSEQIEALNLRSVEDGGEESTKTVPKEVASDWPAGPWEKLQSRLQEIHDDLLILPDTPLTMRMESLDERLQQWKTELSEAQEALEEKMLSSFSHNQTSAETEAERNRRETRQLLEEQQASLQESLESFGKQWAATLAALEAQTPQEAQSSDDSTETLAASAIHLDLQALQDRLNAQQEVLASWQETFMASLETSLSSLSGGQIILDNHVQEYHQALHPIQDSLRGLSQQFEAFREMQEKQQERLEQTQTTLLDLTTQSQSTSPQKTTSADSPAQELMFKTLESRVFGDEMVQRLTMTGLVALLAVGLMAAPEGLFGQWVFKKWLYVVPMLWTASGWFGLVTLQRRWNETLERAKALGRPFLDEDQEIFRGWMIKLSHRLLGLLLVFQLLLFFFF